MVGTKALLGAAAAAAACAEAPGVLVRATPGVAAGSALRAGTAVAVCGVPASVKHTMCDLYVHTMRSHFKLVCWVVQAEANRWRLVAEHHVSIDTMSL